MADTVRGEATEHNFPIRRKVPQNAVFALYGNEQSAEKCQAGALFCGLRTLGTREYDN